MEGFGTIGIRSSIKRMLEEYFKETKVLIGHPQSVVVPREHRQTAFLAHAVEFIHTDMASFERRIDELVTLHNGGKLAKKLGDMFRSSLTYIMDERQGQQLNNLIQFVSDKLGTPTNHNKTRTIEWIISYCIVTKKDEFTDWMKERLDLRQPSVPLPVVVEPEFEDEEDRKMHQLEKSLMMPIKWKPVTSFIINAGTHN